MRGLTQYPGPMTVGPVQPRWDASRGLPAKQLACVNESTSCLFVPAGSRRPYHIRTTEVGKTRNFGHAGVCAGDALRGPRNVRVDEAHGPILLLEGLEHARKLRRCTSDRSSCHDETVAA